MTNPNPFQQQAAPPQAPVPDAAQQFPGQVTPAEMQAHQAQGFNPVPQQAQQFAPPVVQQATGYDQAAQQAAQGQHPVQQAYAQQAPAQSQQFAPPVQQQAPWSPEQHAAYNQQREAGMSAIPQGYAPQAPPVQQQMPAPAPQGLPQAPFPGQQMQNGMPGFGGAQAPGGGAFDPSMFGAPSAGGGAYPKVRDLNGRLCLFRVKSRDQKGTAYKDPSKEQINYVANVAVLDGGPLWSSPPDDQPMAQPEMVSETVPYVVGDMTIGPKGLQNRLKADFVRGRVVRMPMGEFEKQLMGGFPGMQPWQALATWIAQDPRNESLLAPGTYFWGIVEDNSPQADQLVAQFSTNPIARELML